MKSSNMPHDSPPVFTSVESAHLIVRRFRVEDLASFMVYRSDPDVMRYQGWKADDQEKTLRFIREMSDAAVGAPGQWFQFAVEHRADGALIGDMGMHVSLEERRQAEIGYTLARAYQGQGLGSEMVSALLDFAFGVLGLHRITARILTDNRASIDLAERLNFRREAHFVEEYWFDDRWCDEYLFAMLAREWRSQPGRTNTLATT